MFHYGVLRPDELIARTILKIEVHINYKFLTTSIFRKTGDDTCINNLRLNNNSKDHHRLRYGTSRHADNAATYTRQPRGSKYLRGSLENVSNVRVERNQLQEPASLRRCRSLALTKEDVFNSLEIRNEGRPNRRAQLIPRAKLVERNPKEQRYGSRVVSTEDLYSRSTRTSTRHKSNLDPPLAGKSNRRNDISSTSLDTGRYPQENEYDSLEYQPVQYEKIVEPPGLNLPNYYPDSRYESDNTDNISVVDNISVSTAGYKKYLSCDNLSTRNFQEEPESISYDENIVLSKNRPLYNSLQDTTYERPRTIRSPSAITSEEYFSATSCRSERSAKISKERSKSDEESLNQRKNKNNFSPIERKTERRKKISVDNQSSSNESSTGIYSNVEINPLYDVSKSVVRKESQTIQEIQPAGVKISDTNEEELATRIDIDYENNQISDDFKTVVRVDSNTTTSSTTTDEETKTENKEKQHSHNYLREFLESQKGSKKPLQNFLSKKFPNLSRKNSKEKQTNLIDNNFHSLPDITACKNLKKCDKIDRKLRKCEKVVKSGESENRFIVNIGKHFDIAANSNIPVDFELKIAKVSRKNKQRHTQKPDEFLEAVKYLKKTLKDSNQNDTKPEIIGIKTKTSKSDEENCNQCEIEVTMDLVQADLEYQNKLGNMRTYWNKLVGHKLDADDNTIQEDNVDLKCKIVDVKTKVDEVKKKFEQQEEQQEKPVNKVQMAKQIFENKPTEKIEKVSPLIKNTCGFFENSSFEKSNQFESLNPNVVEIIERKNEIEKVNSEEEDNFRKELESNTLENKKQHKPVTKSLSITYPEFDHVRYRVVKSDLFQKKIFANCEKESQFDGLMQYLQDYSFQELLIDNNIVIIEPIRTTIIRENTNNCQKTVKNVTPLLRKNNESLNEKNGLRKHFFYHPIRVNKEVNDDELPNPDTVKQVRQLFEKSDRCFNNVIKKKLDNKEKHSDPDKDHCSVSSGHSNNSENVNQNPSSFELFGDEPCCEQQYITEDMMEKIRKYGTTITYYGGRIVKKQCSQESLTNVIMEEIKNNESRDFHGKYDTVGEKENMYQGLRFKLVKSNSCSSRLELVGTPNLAASKKKYHNKHKEMIKEATERKTMHKSIANNKQNEHNILNKNEINECIKKQTNAQLDKEITENRTYIKWGDTKQEQTIYGIQFNEKIIDKIPQKVKYDFHNFEQLNHNSRIIEDMDFEPFEIA